MHLDNYYKLYLWPANTIKAFKKWETPRGIHVMKRWCVLSAVCVCMWVGEWRGEGVRRVGALLEKTEWFWCCWVTDVSLPGRRYESCGNNARKPAHLASCFGFLGWMLSKFSNRTLIQTLHTAKTFSWKTLFLIFNDQNMSQAVSIESWHQLSGQICGFVFVL